MHILVIDRDLAAAETLVNVLTSQGHQVMHETIRKTAQEMVNNQHFDMIFIDPAPQPSPKEFTLPLRWNRREHYTYMVLTGHDIPEGEVTRSGMNNFLSKPYQGSHIEHLMLNAKRLIGFMERLNTGEGRLTDTHIFGHRAFYQLLLSALDRSYRYHEQAYLLMIRFNNTKQVLAQFGQDVVEQIQQELGNYLSSLHRLSDFLGHAEYNEYGLLILRPGADSEPQDAVDRFAIALDDFRDRINLPLKPEFGLYLWTLPDAGIMLFKEVK